MDHLTAGSDRAHWMLLLAQHRAHLLTAFAGMTAEQLHGVADDTGWTLAEVLAHVTVWEQRVSGLLPAILASESPAVPTPDPDEFNRRSFADIRSRGVPAVLAELVSARKAMLDTLAAASDEEIQRERRLPSGKPFTVRQWAIQELAEHEADHAEHIRATRKARGARPSQGPKAVLAAGFAAAHDYLMTAVACIPAGQEATLAVTGGWTLREVLGHVADWSFTIADGVDAALSGRALTEVEFNKLQEWNDAHNARRNDESWQKVKADYDESWRRVSTALDKVDESQFGLDAARNERGPIALYPWLFIVPHHEEEHAGYLKDWAVHAV
jgi:hypothetical protein